VVIYHPEHNLAPSRLAEDHWRKIVDVWVWRHRELAAQPDIQYVYIFENTGEAIGVTMPHPHGQIYAFPFVPPLIQRELDAAFDHQREHAECIFCARRHFGGVTELTGAEASSLAAIIKKVRMKYDNIWSFPMPLMMLLRQNPVKGEHPYFHFHVDLYPIQRSATKLKYVAGVESGAGTFLNDTVAEDKAREFRETEPRG
jgi:UDPglucose--hexose-1-phosphate uridylyltransferase